FFGLCLVAFLGQSLVLASLLVVCAFCFSAFLFFGASGELAVPLLFATAALVRLTPFLGLALLPAARFFCFALADSARKLGLIAAPVECRFFEELNTRHLDLGFTQLGIERRARLRWEGAGWTPGPPGVRG